MFLGISNKDEKLDLPSLLDL